MNKIAVLLAALGISHGVVEAQEPSDSVLELSCTAFPPDLREDDLIARYGSENVRTDSLKWGGEHRGIGTILFPGSSEARLEVIWRDAEARARPYHVKVRADRSRKWSTPNGIRPGDSLKELEEENGRPFRLAGFNTELSGKILSWGGGFLELPPEEACIWVYIQPPYHGSADFDLFRQVRWGREYSSGHPAMQQLPLRVVSITLGPIRE